MNKDLSVPADAPFAIEFDNQDAGQPHNIEIKDSSGATVFKGDLVTGPAETDLQRGGARPRAATRSSARSTRT